MLLTPEQKSEFNKLIDDINSGKKIDLLREAEWKLDVLYLESAPVRYSIDRRIGATLPGQA